MSDQLISVVAPLENDEDIVGSFVDEAISVLQRHYEHYELILVDDGSIDQTTDRVTALLERYEFVRLVRLSKSFGQEIAISAGLDTAIGDFVVVMLPETDPPELIPAMIDRCRAGAGIVFGIRSQRKGQGWAQRLGAAGFYWYCNRLAGLRIPKDATHFRALSRQAVNALAQIRDRTWFLRSLSSYVGFQDQGFVYDPICRRKKPRRPSLYASVRLALDIVVSNSIHPLRIASFLALGAALLNGAFLLAVVVVYLMKDQVAEGWTTQSFQQTSMAILVSLILAVLCEYVGSLVSEAKSRPLYYVIDEKNSSAMPMKPSDRNVATNSVE